MRAPPGLTTAHIRRAVGRGSRPPPSPDPRPPTSGFTLVEVLVATVLLAVGLVAAVGAFSASTRASARAQDQTLAALAAQRVLAEVEAAPTREPGREEGDFGNDASGYTWVADIRETRWEGVLQLDVEVISPGAGARHHRISTYITEGAR